MFKYDSEQYYIYTGYNCYYNLNQENPTQLAHKSQTIINWNPKTNELFKL